MLKLIRSFSSREAIEFGQSLADTLAKQYPPKLEAKGIEKLSADRISRILENIYTTAQEHQGTSNYGIYKKGRLCHAFKWRMIELGYGKTFVDLATEGLVVYLNKRNTR